MKNIVIIMVISASAYYGYQHMMQPGGQYDDSGNPQSLLFLFDDCGRACTEAESFLKGAGIEYERINLSSDAEAENRLRSLGGSNTMPQLYTGTRRVDGFHHLRYKEALGETYGLNALTGNVRDTFASHFYEDGSPKLVMYGASWCPHCKNAREFFQDNGLEFKEWDVEKESEGKRYYQTLEGTGYPLIYVGFRRVSTNTVKSTLKDHPHLL